MFNRPKKWGKALWAKELKEPVKKPRWIPRRSKEGRKRETAYNKRVREWKKEHPMCAWPGCDNKTSDVHHVRGRLGKLLMDERYWTAVCEACHFKIHNQPELARANGMLAKLGEWNCSN